VSYPTIELGNVVDTVMGQAPPGNTCNKEGIGTVFVKAGEFADPLPIVREWTTAPLKLARRSDVLICVVGATAGKVSRSIDCAIGRSAAAVRPKPGKMDTDFLFYFLSTKVVFLRDKSQGLAQGVVTRDMIEALQLKLPPLVEQRRIAAILDAADALRRKRRESLEMFQCLKASLFDHAFGDPVLNPKNWARRKMEDICARLTVGIVVKPASYYRDAGVPAIRGTNIKPWGIDLSDVVFFSEEDNANRLRKTRVWEDDLVIVRSGRPGLTAVVPKHLHGANSIDVLIATLDKTQVRPAFLKDFLNSGGGKRIVTSESRGQIQQHFNVGSLSEALVYCPPLQIQDKYLENISRTDRITDAARKHLSELDGLFTILQHRTFRGEL
jgi:type I restriction enzyme S subunit